ncbi:AbgT family transporter [Ruminococcaceae bacterium OttesenSCG-928-D13]|nr:AbgT family transporter [Ruminococcaceae bacterium OttesenSCG-928-D13]
MEQEQVKKKKFKVPHVFVIIMGMALLCALLTYVIPAGQYDRVENADGRMVVDPDSFHYVERTPVNLFMFFQSFHQGLEETAGIIFFLFIVGGSFSVVQATGAIEAVLGHATKKMSGKERLLVPVVMILFSLGGATFGMAEEALPFIPIMVMLAISLGFDSLTGAAIVMAGAGAGFAGAFLNPFTVGVAQGIAGLPLSSGMGLRIVLYFAMTALTIGYVFWYTGRLKKNPSYSLMYEFDQTREDKLDMSQLKKMSARHIIIILIMIAAIITFTVGVIQFGWYFKELTAVFLVMAIASALIGGMGLDGFAEELTKGMATIASGALIVGFARAILVIMTQGQIIDTILYGAASLVGGLPSWGAAVGMYIFQCFLNFLIPSGSGQAAVSMPIMAPLADLTGVTRQTAVLAYQLGDGISNIFTPTSGYFMAGLALAKVPWSKWAKWFWKLLLLQYALGLVFILIATATNYGPF